MRYGLVGVLVFLGVVLPTPILGVQPQRAHADQRRDWFVAGPREEGTYLSGDFLLGAVQATLAHDRRIYGSANQLTLFGSGMAALPYGTAQAGFDFRIVAISLGASVGVTHAWRGLGCSSDEPCDRDARREKDASGNYRQPTFAFGELRAQLFLPFNRYVTGTAQLTWNVSSAPDRMYDYQNAVVHDGEMLRANFMLFVLNRAWGAAGPTLQLLNFPLDGQRRTQTNFGITALTRAGLVQRDDLFVVQFLWHDARITGGYDNRDTYGSHLWRGPFSLLLAYRAQMTL